jgi:hypothetical protein
MSKRDVFRLEKFFSAIGRFMVEFSQLEFFLKVAAADAIELKSEYVAQ